MAWMNEGEVEQLLSITRTAPDARAYAPLAKFLHDWMETVNSNSDGWAHWSGGTRPASKLMEGLEAVRVAFAYGRRHGVVLPTPEALRKTLGPIKACATKHGFPQPVLEA